MGRRSAGARLAGEFLPGTAALLALLAAGAFSTRARERAEEAADLVRRTLLVREGAERLLGAVRDGETGQRGYVITGDPRFLTPFEMAQPRAAEELRRLRGTVHSGAQSGRLDAIDRLTAMKFAELRGTVALVAAGRGADAVAAVRSGQGKEVMDRLRAEADAFKAQETRLLAAREAAAAREGRRALAGTRFSGLALLVAALLQVAQWRRRRRDLLARAGELEAEVAARTEALERERVRVEALLADVNHRVGNDLAAVGVLLNMQARRSAEPAVKAALGEAQDRVRVIAEAQRRLRLDVGTDTVRAPDVLGPALDMLAERLGGAGVSVHRELADVAMPGRDALSLVIIANELVTNAAKHAFPTGGGRVDVRLAPVGDGFALVVADDGVGMAGAGAKGMGTNVVASLARGMGAGVRREDAAPGTRVVVSTGEAA